MKNWIFVVILLAGTASARAQFLSRESVAGAVLGGLVGGVIGHNHHRQTAEGIAIGAGAGLLLGSLSHHARHHHASYHARYDHPAPYVHPAPVVRTHVYRPAHYRASHAATGAVLGGIAGGIIGHNHHRQTAEGIAIGAGAGLILGAIADRERRQEEVIVMHVEPQVIQAAAPVHAETVAAPETPPVRPVATPLASATPMSGANALFGR